MRITLHNGPCGLEISGQPGAHSPRSSLNGRQILGWARLPEFVSWACHNGVTLSCTPGAAVAYEYFVDRLERAEGRSYGLYKFQCAGVRFLVAHNRAIFADEMGLGKTVQALIAIDSHAVVVAPAHLLKNWVRECARWRPDLQVVTVATSVDAKSTDQHFCWPEPGELVLVSYALQPANPDLKRTHGRIAPGTTLIADEAHSLKKYQAIRTRRFRKLSSRVLAAEGAVWLMTGTPVLNTPKDLWHLLQSAGATKVLYNTMDAYAALMGGEKDFMGVWEWDPEKIKPEGLQQLQACSLRRTRQQVLKDMPEKSVHFINVERPDSAELQKSLDFAYAELAPLVAADTLSEVGGVEAISRARKALAIAKIPIAKKLIASYAESREPVVVFSAHREPIRQLGSQTRWGTVHGETKDRDAVIQAFQDGRLDGIALTIKSGGVGHTLTRAAIALFLDQEWTPGLNEQAEDRLCRIGQTRPVSIYVMVMDHPLDYLVARILNTKEKIIGKTTGSIPSEHYYSGDHRATLELVHRSHT